LQGKRLRTQFERELERALRLRAASIRRSVLGGTGSAPRITRARARKEIDKLERLAREIFIRKYSVKEFNTCITTRRSWHPKTPRKGWGVAAKKQNFREWYEREVDSPNCVYAFWANKRCEYIGRTIRGRGRPSAHLEKFWFSRVTRIDIYVVRRASEVPKVECLAIDRWEPRRNRVRSAQQQYARKCPVCSRSREVKKELMKLFRLRK
jgi:hypothetical protein